MDVLSGYRHRFLSSPLLPVRFKTAASLMLLTLFSMPVHSEDVVRQHQVSLQGPTTGEVIDQTVTNPNEITLSAMNSGINNCSSRINQVTNSLGFGHQTGALLMPPIDQPNKRIIPLAMEVPINDASGYVSVNFAPNQSNGCGAVYEAIAFWPQLCDGLEREKFSGLKNLGTLKNEITVLDGGATTKIFLMPAGSGCLSIKKEVVM